MLSAINCVMALLVEWYNFWYMALRCHQKITPQVASIDETIRIIVEDQCSVSRFGDGEMLLTNPDKEIGFQKEMYSWLSVSRKY